MARETILIVEDQQGFRRIYRDVLEREGYQILESEDGEAGWQLVKSKKPDLVLLDLGLPVIDGFEVLKRIRADAETKLIPVIIFSILGEQKDIKRGMELGASDYTVKGFYTPKQILSKIKDLLAKSGKKKTANSYRLKIAMNQEEVGRLHMETGLPDGCRCSKCQTEMILEIFPDYVRTDGHWFSSRFVCPKCGETF
jgi:DNA-binding response OmpR family regulator